ncbi:hypothetical protein [uncultured Trichococcus sp.]|uniref:hypothetical protein n=1 Tax=uncultured Trichococcus sp. TaxID=189665 RepID=UPI002A18998B|nr:hypothetical protein [uncultured Trichococcus sp.]
MIQSVIGQQNVAYKGGFIATYADAVTLHMTPGNLYKYDIAVVIKGDGTMWAKRVTEQNTNKIQDEWLEIAKDTIKSQKSPFLRNACFFKIKEGSLYGTYIISEDFIKNGFFSDEQSYLKFITN